MNGYEINGLAFQQGIVQAPKIARKSLEWDFDPSTAGFANVR